MVILLHTTYISLDKKYFALFYKCVDYIVTVLRETKDKFSFGHWFTTTAFNIGSLEIDRLIMKTIDEINLRNSTGIVFRSLL